MTAPTATVVLSGGAPNGALTAGALCGIYEQKKTFNTFYTSGAGAVFGLLTIAPARGTAADALAATKRAGIHDAIYDVIPLGYKTFLKSGPFTAPIKKLADKLKLEESDDPEKSSFPQLYNDWIDLWAAAITPTFVNPRSEGVCAPFPFAEEFIDFEKVSKFKGRFYMNAYCIETGEMEHFTNKDKQPITADHFRAALAFPFVYPPATIGAKHYYEGSALDPLNLPRLWEQIETGDIPNNDRHTVVLIDVLGALQRALIRRPRHLVDAYGISIITPIVSLAQAKLELFKSEQRKMNLLPLTFDVPPSLYPTLADWSRSNLRELFEIGREAGTRFCRKHGDKLPDRVDDSAEAAR
jgi:NTE family protein